jgi:hypothetical protein
MPIKAAYLQSSDHILDALDQMSAEKSSLRSRLILVVTGPLVFGLLSWINRDRSAAIFGTAIYFIFIYLFAFCRPLRRWQRRRNIAKQIRSDALPVQWTFDDSDVIQQTDSESVSRFAWQHFTRVIQRPAGFLLETKNKQFHWIPRESISPDDTFDGLARLLKQNTTLYEIRD